MPWFLDSSLMARYRRFKADISTWRLNSQLRHAWLDPASSLFLDPRLRGNDNQRVFNRRSNNKRHSDYHHRKVLGAVFPFLQNCKKVGICTGRWQHTHVRYAQIAQIKGYLLPYYTPTFTTIPVVTNLFRPVFGMLSCQTL